MPIETTKNRAVFLDRDGVINQDLGYVHKVSDFVFLDGVFDACRLFEKLGFCLIVVTNQSGVGRGFYSEADVEVLHQWMVKQFSQNGINISKVYFCPHHMTHGLGDYKQDCDFRKPKPGMLLRAKAEFNLDMSQSIMIGDKTSDMQVGNNAGVGRSVYITDNPVEAVSVVSADDYCHSLFDFANNLAVK